MAAGELSPQVRRFPPSRVGEGVWATPWEGMGDILTANVTKEVMSASS